ncbi:hypothetical protein ACEZ3G_10045 [Maribacter algicola]|uniref:Uncharacterized protein n=1 Tax=Meishania litoralis TaxID=3434685 RepID=A0ACC7LJS7_9FLAO
MTNIKPPTWFWIVSVLALLWNLMGVGAYLADAFMSVEALGEMSQEMRELYEGRPAWATAAYAIAVWFGALGCIALLMRKKWAVPVFLISLIGIVGQQIYNFFLSNTFEVVGSGAMFLPIMVVVIGVALWLFARSSAAKNWIS